MTENKIPKIIHYCWFGNNEKSELVKKCIASWKKYLPDYEIREWAEKDLVNCNIQYVKESYKEKIWAFVSDYFRLYALYNYGGIYLDTDMEILKPLDEFLDLDFFACQEELHKTNRPLATCILGAKKQNLLIKEMLDLYNNISIYDESHKVIYCPNTERFKTFLQEEYNIKEPYNSEETIVLNKTSIIYPSYYFQQYKSNFSYAIHHGNGSWIPDLLCRKKKHVVKNIFLKIYTIKKGCFLKEIKNIKDRIIFFYPRIKKRTVVISIGKGDENE